MNSNNNNEIQKLLDINLKLLDSIIQNDYNTYNELCADDMTCIEPESNKQVVIGKAFHKYYFALQKDPHSVSGQDNIEKNNNASHNNRNNKVNVSMSNPHVRLVGGDTIGIISYIRLNQIFDDTTQQPITTQYSETRIWEKRDNKWIHIHFHKS